MIKFVALFLIFLASVAFADTCPYCKGRIRIVRDTIRLHDTITVTKLIFIRDTTKMILMKETISVPHYIALLPTLKVEQPAPILEKYMLNLYGGANTNGYNVLLGATVYLGSRVS